MSNPSMLMRRSLRSVLVPLGIYFAASFLVYGAIVPTVTVKWHGQRLLERVDLEDSPVRSLLLLHSQPPALNALLAFCLQTSEIVGVPVKSIVTTLVTSVGAGSIVFLYLLVAGLTKSQWFGAAAAGAAVLDPGFQFYRLWFLAALLIYFLIAATLFLAFKALDTGDRRILAAAVLAVPLLPNTKSVFHPAWATVFVIVLVVLFMKIHHKPAAAKPSNAVLTLIGFLLLLFAWPAKNAVLFDSFAFSSWSGFNVARGTPVRSKALKRYLRDGTTTAAIDADIERFRDRFGDSQLHILARPTRANGSRNRNHYAFVSTKAELVTKAVRYRTTNLHWWFKSSLINYRKWTRATFVHPYSDEIRGNWAGPYRAVVRAVRGIFFADLGFLLRWIADPPQQDSKQQETVFEGRWTLYGLIVFPGLVVVASILMVRDFVRGPDVGTGISMLCLFTICWHLAAVCLTDGAEGNRMRFGVAPCTLVLALCVLARGWETVKARRVQLSRS